MKSIFVIRNQHGRYLSKQHEWLEGREAAALYRTPHRDEAINTLFEASVRDTTLRAEVLACRLDERNLPRVDDHVDTRVEEPDESAAADVSEATDAGGNNP